MPPQRVLIVEDEEHLRHLLQEFLDFEDYSCVLAENGFQALELVKKESFDLILLDYLMPEMDGLEVARQLRAMGIEIPIVMLTAADSEAGRLTAAALGINEFVAKPFSVNDLLKVIRYQLRFALKH